MSFPPDQPPRWQQTSCRTWGHETAVVTDGSNLDGETLIREVLEDVGYRGQSRDGQVQWYEVLQFVEVRRVLVGKDS